MNVIDDRRKPMFKKMFGNVLYPRFSVVEDEGGQSDDKDPAEEGEDSVTDDEYDAEVKKRGAKNIIEENRRRAKELKELRDENEALKKPKTAEPKKEPENKGADLPAFIMKRINKWTKEQPENMRVNEEFLRDIATMSIETAIDAINYHLNSNEGMINKKFSALSKVEKRYANESLKETISDLGKKADYKFVISKYRDEVETEIKKAVNPDKWDDPEVIELVVSKVGMKHLKELGIGTEDDGEEKGNKVKEKINETGDGSKVVAQGVTATELKEYAEEHNIDLSDANAKQQAIKGAAAKKKALDRLE